MFSDRKIHSKECALWAFSRDKIDVIHEISLHERLVFSVIGYQGELRTFRISFLIIF